MGEREISSKVLGEIIMSELKVLDDVAYVRFASVYRDFQDIDAFQQELANIRPADKND
jgi:transcriptional repressor NrdR